MCDCVNEYVLKYKTFFYILERAISNGDNVKRDDELVSLRCGFIVNGKNKYFMGEGDLKYAQKDEKIDISIYADLKH